MATNHLSVSALAMRMTLQKQYNAQAYSHASQTICAYSQSIGKMLAGYADVDASVASILKPLVFIAAQGESDNAQQQMAVKAVIYPVVFAEPSFGPESDNDGEAVGLLQSLLAMESYAAQTLEAYTQEPAAQEIGAVVSVAGLVQASKARARELKRTLESIKNGTFWSRDEEIRWGCMQCGYTTKSTTAFSECECCHGGREYASAI